MLPIYSGTNPSWGNEVLEKIGAEEAVASGVRTPDLGGDAGTTGFTDEVIRLTRSKLAGATGAR